MILVEGPVAAQMEPDLVLSPLEGPFYCQTSPTLGRSSPPRSILALLDIMACRHQFPLLIVDSSFPHMDASWILLHVIPQRPPSSTEFQLVVTERVRENIETDLCNVELASV